MGDPGPFQGDLVIGHHIRAEVQLVELVVLPAQGVGGEGLAVFGHLAHGQLELGEHGLAIHGALELVHEVVDEIGPLLLVGGLFQQVAHQQHLVAGGGHLGHEDHIVAGADGLIFAAVIAVQGMAHLVGQGKLAVQIVLVVQQDIGVGTAVAGGVGAAALADVLVHVDPAVAEALLQQVHIVVTQHLQGLQHGLLGLLIGDGLVGVGHDGGVHIVHMQLVHAQQLLAQGNVAVHLVQVVVNGLDEVHVHRHGDLGGVQGGLNGAVVMAGVGKEAQLLELAVQCGGDGVLILAQLLVIGLEGPAAQLPVGAGQQGNEGGVRQGMDAALAVGDVGEDLVGVAENAGDVLRSVGHFTGGGQQTLLGRGENVVLAAADLVQATAIGLQLRLLRIEPIQGFLGNGHDLGGGKGGGAGDGHIHVHGLAPDVLIKAVSGVLVALAAGIAHEHAQPQLDLVLQPEPGQQVPGAAGQGALKGGDFGGERLHGLVFRHPGLVAGEHVLQVPGHLLRNFTALGNSLIGHKITPP